ncbi:MAG: hypothetical protein IIW58_05185 [Bacteroidales bacterium]|nr:hypothetical protein [Bacteroidales bacterium]
MRIVNTLSARCSILIVHSKQGYTIYSFTETKHFPIETNRNSAFGTLLLAIKFLSAVGYRITKITKFISLG